jgi:ATP-dependent Clp protease ATP-binding subunit ClpC
MSNNNLYEKFTKSVMQIVIWAKAASIDAKASCLYTESFIISMLSIGENEVTVRLSNANIDLDKCLKIFKHALINKRASDESGAINYNEFKVAKLVIDACKAADTISQDMESEVIDIRHLFLGLLQVDQSIKSVFVKEGFDPQAFIESLKHDDVVHSNESTPSSKSKNGQHNNQNQNKSSKGSALAEFCVDITEQARTNQLDPIIARDTEIEEAITILCRKIKNNPILLGKPGVGKSAIIEGIAQRIVSGTVPKKLIGSKLYSLSLSSLVAGTKYRGQFEERLDKLVKEIKATKGCILFIDEIHTMIGAGRGDGALDASNILKPFLAKGDLRCIGATTLDDFKKHFRKDEALIRRFQSVSVEEPNNEQMHRILAGIRPRFEEYHNCIISDDALDAAINLSARYLTQKNFPDKAIDCIDTACAKYSWDKSRNGVQKPVINADDIVQIISEQCQIPKEIMLWDNFERIKKIEDDLVHRG